MALIILAFCVFAALVWLGRRGPKQPNEWRSAAGIVGLACIVAGIAVMVRGLVLAGAVTIAVGLALGLVARRVPLPFGPMTDDEARRVLGVDVDAGEAEIQAAYRARMRTAHPDQGGDEAVAARLNTARDRLLKKR
ncbi:MAG: molecular chaperone DnaJ [Caulobacteraceae bacterium]|nr:molecular chaperone DnaJ [Caulobacteraceae bacterium]